MIDRRLAHNLVQHTPAFTIILLVGRIITSIFCRRLFDCNTMSRSLTCSALRPCSSTKIFQNSIRLRLQPSTSKPRNSLTFSARWKSTASAPKPSLASEAAATPKVAPSVTEKESLPWAEYLSIRKSKRRWETVSFHI